MSYEVARLGPERRADFYRVHCEENGAGWCRCVAWWVEGWQGWGERSAEENLALREELFERGEWDGYLLYEDGLPIGWCQVGRRDRLPKLVSQFELEPDPHTWAITCFVIARRHRRRGAARVLLRGVLDDLPARGAERVEAYPKRGESLDELDLWNGPEELYRRAGFEVVVDGEPRALLALELAEPG